MFKKVITILFFGCFFLSIAWSVQDVRECSAATASEYQATPPFVTAGVPPLVMLVMGRNHKLYYEAYNDASDLNGDDVLDVGYNPNIEYYGYFDSYKGYTYDAGDGRFEPTSHTADKKVVGASEWSGDFLNYLTMSRMDCMRKVLYGGLRSTDTSTDTVLKRAYIPQDAHSWGKEYHSVLVDGFDIEDYTPLSLPSSGTRHLFASTTLSDNGDPILRVLPNNTHRIWEWVAKERPVCDGSLESAGGAYGSHPNSHADYDNMVAAFANASHLQGTLTPPTGGRVNSDDFPDKNPFDADNDNYMTILTGGLITTTATDTYQFIINGDDAIELIIDGTVVQGWYGGHGTEGTGPWNSAAPYPAHTLGSIVLAAGTHTFEFRHEEGGGGDSFYLWWNQGDTVDTWEVIPAASFSGLSVNYYALEVLASTITDYKVFVQVGVNAGGISPASNCKMYPDGNYKPIGLLQRHGESGRMYFGLLSGSYTKNTSGGVLRKNIASINDEIDSSTGEFEYLDTAGIGGIIKTIDNFRVVDFDYGSYSYNSNCGWVTNRTIGEGECRMWGNPVGEMMYETLRYFSGTKTPTADFTYPTGSNDDNDLGLPKPDWRDPYTDGEDLDGDGVLDAGEDLNGNGTLDGFEYCAKPFMLVLSDINPTYDSDQLPGSYFDAVPAATIGGAATALDVDALADTITTTEGDAGSHFIGQMNATFDGACTAKAVTGFGDIRGLCPEEPTKEGSYYSSSVAYYGRKEDMHNTASGDQNVNTFAVGLASPLPRINITVGANTITLVPFGKSVGTGGGPYAGYFPTNTIVDFFVEEITATGGKFRINYEDVEQGADHDMDAIVEYEYEVVAGNVNITLTSTYAAGGIVQHMGYIISGTTADGIYLEVRDFDTGSGSDHDYVLDTPPGQPPGGVYNDGVALPLVTTRTFTPGATPGATLLKDPLWYAAKWGAFEEDDSDSNDIPDQASEWDDDSDGVPDNYYYVQNPLELEQQLNKSFADILRRTSSGSAASVISQSRSGEGAIYQAVFYPEYSDSLGNTVSWVGDVHALLVDEYGYMREDTNGNHALDTKDEDKNSNSILDTGEDLNGNGLLDSRDYMIVFEGSSVYKYDDANENLILDDEDLTVFDPAIPAWYNNGSLDKEDLDNDSVLDPGEDLNGNLKLDTEDANDNGVLDSEKIAGSFSMLEVGYLWSSSEWLNELTETQAITQRASYASTDDNRYIFTFVDEDEDMVVDAGEQVAFECPALPTDFTDLADDAKIYPYLLLFDSFSDEPAEIGTLRTTFNSVFENYLRVQTQRLINYTRGQDQSAYTSATVPPYTLQGFRSRQLDYDEDATVETWRMGDIVYSTPTLVGRPSEGYHLLYRDTTYATFAQQYLNRRQVAYVGGNDGMFHAFNGGFFDNATDTFKTQRTTETAFDLGAEMWAYVPYNLLPHLYWLTETEYAHNYYCDMKPRIFDAKIFSPDADHPGGWGTVLVGSMRLGGGEIQADMNKNDGAAFNGAVDRTMSSSFFILDITNPETAPTVLAELSFDDLGYTTCYPGIIVLKDKVGAVINENAWYLVLGSGPADASGAASIQGTSALSEAASDQPAKLFVIDLVELGTNGNLRTIDTSGNYATVEPFHYVELDTNSFISDPVAVDFDLDYSTDAMYFGTVSGDDTIGWGGKLRRLVVDNNLAPSTWDGDSVLMDLIDQPVTAAPSVALDITGNKWVYFGTGRYIVQGDSSNTDNQSYYGIIEPVDGGGNLTWATVLRDEPFVDADSDSCYDLGETYTDVDSSTSWDSGDLLNVTRSIVYTDRTVEDTCDSGIANWTDLLNDIGTTYQGWQINFTTSKERNLGQATLLGNLLTFTTYVPSTDACSFEGESYLYAVHYRTGTAYYNNVIGTEYDAVEDNVKVDKKKSLGQGLAVTPNIHVGREGTKAVVQTSTGAILSIDQDAPGDSKSAVSTWEHGCN